MNWYATDAHSMNEVCGAGLAFLCKAGDARIGCRCDDRDGVNGILVEAANGADVHTHHQCNGGGVHTDTDNATCRARTPYTLQLGPSTI